MFWLPPCLLLAILHWGAGALAIRCYSCASLPYLRLYDKGSAIERHKHRPRAFSRDCDTPPQLRLRRDLMVDCPHETTCVTLFGVEYTGGVYDPEFPYRFVRGCADSVLEPKWTSNRPTSVRDGTTRPVEVLYLKRETHCTRLPNSQIWPRPATKVSPPDLDICSCRTDGCNVHVRPANLVSASTRMDVHFLSLIAFSSNVLHRLNF